MPRQRIIIIGGVATGPKAAARARRLLPDADITIIEQGQWISYGSCGIPHFLGGIVKEARELATTSSGDLRDVHYFASVREINVLNHHRAEEIKRGEQQVVIRNLITNEITSLAYDRLVLATGARPVAPPFLDLELDGVYLLHDLDQAILLRNRLTQGVPRIVVVGGGLIGLEVTNFLQKRNQKVTLVELQEQVMPAQLDAEIAALVKKRLEERGVDVLTSTKCSEIVAGDNKVAGVKTNQSFIPADLVIVAIGVRPCVELAESAGLELGTTGAIAVDRYLTTTDPLIFAGGDCVENTNLITGKPVYTPMASIATKHGRVIGDNLAGKNSAFPGVLGTAALSVFDLNVGRTGLTERQAKDMGFEAQSMIISGYDAVHYHPMHGRGVLKLIAEAKNGKLLGAQVIGEGDVIKRLDSLATGLQLGVSLEQLANLDLAYAPDYATPQDLLIHAANAMNNQLTGPVKGIKLAELPDDGLLLDVRSQQEKEAWPLTGFETINIPLNTLRREFMSLPQNRPIIAFCELGTRSYEAACILKSKGFAEVYFLEGGLEANRWWPETKK